MSPAHPYFVRLPQFNDPADANARLRGELPNPRIPSRLHILAVDYFNRGFNRVRFSTVYQTLEVASNLIMPVIIRVSTR